MIWTCFYSMWDIYGNTIIIAISRKNLFCSFTLWLFWVCNVVAETYVFRGKDPLLALQLAKHEGEISSLLVNQALPY